MRRTPQLLLPLLLSGLLVPGLLVSGLPAGVATAQAQPQNSQSVKALPADAQPESGLPQIAQRTNAQPDSGLPGAVPLDASQPAACQPAASQPAASQPAAGQPNNDAQQAIVLRPVVEPGHFEVGVPAGWSRQGPSMGLTDAERGVFPLRMRGPGTLGGIASEISIAYYAPGNLLHKTAEHYVRLHAAPVFGEAQPGENYSQQREITLAGRGGLRFERTKLERCGPRSLNPIQTPVYEGFVVLPAKAGFYVLRCRAGLPMRAAVTALFEAVLASFKPLVD